MDKKVKLVSVFASISVVLITAIALMIFTCCSDAGNFDEKALTLDWSKKLSNGNFVLSGSNYSCPYTKIKTTGGGMAPLTLFSYLSLKVPQLKAF